MSRDPLVYVNGEYRPAAEASVSVFDHGLLYGDGVFEGIRAYNGRVFRLDEHIARLYASAKAICLQIPLTRSQMSSIVLDACRRNDLRDAYIRLLVTRGRGDLGVDPRNCTEGPGIIVIAVPALSVFGDRAARGLHLVTVSIRRVAHDALNPSIKSLNYLNSVLAKIEAGHRGADEALMLDAQGYVAEATVDNIFIARRSRLTTPWTSTNLDGVTRRTLIELARSIGYEVEERPFALYDVWSADEVIMSGTAIEVQAVVDVDGRTIGDGTIGPIARSLIDAYAAYVRSHGTPIWPDEVGEATQEPFVEAAARR